MCHSNLEEPFFLRLSNFGCRGTATEIKGKSLLMKAYLPKVEAESLDLAALSIWLRQDALVWGLPPPKMRWDVINEEDWASSWKQYWEPTKIGDRFLINPAWLEIPQDSDRIILMMDPGAAFGTGVHPTTQLCIESLEMRLEFQKEPPVLMDIGCGSGILSIAALLLGAKQAYALDTDSLAVKATGSNRDLNKIEAKNLIVKKGSIERAKEFEIQSFDGILCNITAEPIKALIPQMTEFVKPTTWAVFSGILLDQAGSIADVLEENGWIVGTVWKRQNWCCFNVRRS